MSDSKSGQISLIPKTHMKYVLENYGHLFLRNDNPETNGEYTLFRKLAPRLKTIVDIGACDTIYYIENMSSDTLIHLFEPHPVLYDRLLTKISKSPLCQGKQIRTHNVGISDASGALYYYERATSFVNRFGESSSQTFPILRLDNIEELKTAEEISFLKIDVEGFELNVLKGASGLLDKTRYIQFEYGGTYPDSKIKLEDVFAFLKPFGFEHFYYISETHLLEIDQTVPISHYDYCNILTLK